MAKIKLLSYIKESSGGMNDKVFVNPEGGFSLKQVELRKAFSSVSADRKYLSGIITYILEHCVRNMPMTEANIFMNANMKHRSASEPLDLYHDVYFSGTEK